ncbi:MAG: hypothetical protein ACRDYY_10755 [Acidimicrobiales bacterium]
MSEYLQRYNRAAPWPRAGAAAGRMDKETGTGRIRRRDVLGGVIHEYRFAT